MLTVFDHCWLFLNVCDLFWPFSIVFDRFWLYWPLWTIVKQFWPFWTTFDRFGPFLTVLDHFFFTDFDRLFLTFLTLLTVFGRLYHTYKRAKCWPYAAFKKNICTQGFLNTIQFLKIAVLGSRKFVETWRKDRLEDVHWNKRWYKFSYNQGHK